MNSRDRLNRIEPHQAQKHWSTPHKQGLISQVDLISQNTGLTNGSRYPKRRLFQQNHIPPTTAYRILKNPDPRRLHNSRIRPETRGRRSKITPADLRYMELIVQRSGKEGRVLSWKALGIEAGLDVSAETIRRAMGSMAYRRCIACQKSFVTFNIAVRRVEWCRTMLSRYPELED